MDGRTTGINMTASGRQPHKGHKKGSKGAEVCNTPRFGKGHEICIAGRVWMVKEGWEETKYYEGRQEVRGVGGLTMQKTTGQRPPTFWIAQKKKKQYRINHHEIFHQLFIP